MSVPELEGVRLKILRASQHLEALNKSISTFTLSNAYTSAAQFNLKLNGYETMLLMTEDPDPALGVVIGDMVHNLRSALDHLACRLVELTGGNVSKSTQFPIESDRLFRDNKGNVCIKNITIPGMRKGALATRIKAFVEGTQPYTRPEDPTAHELGVLVDLSNADKHRLLHATAGKFQNVTFTLTRKSDGSVVASETRTEIFKNRAQPVFFPAIDDISHTEVQMQGQFSPFVTLDVPHALGDRELGDLLSEVHGFVRDEVAEVAANEFFGGSLDLHPKGGFP